MVELRGSAGHRIDAICNQLITSRQHTSLPPAPALHDAVVVKQEVDEPESNVDSTESANTNHHQHHEYHNHSTQRHHSPRTDLAAAAAAAAADKDKMFFSTHHSPTHSALAALTDW